MKIKENSIELKTNEGRVEKPPIELISRPESPVKLPEIEMISESDGSSDRIVYNRPQRIHSLQYPSQRSEIAEQIVYGGMMDSLYKDNTIFTAYDIEGAGRRTDFISSISGVFGGRDNYGFNFNAVANILMPRSNSDIDEHSHEFVTSEESLMSRGNQSLGGALGSGIATMVANVLDNVSKGYFADYGESIGTPTRATYKGADHRTKTYSWRLSPRNAEDLVALLNIIVVFTHLSYGRSHQSNKVGSVVDRIQDMIHNHYSSLFGKDMNVEETNLLSDRIAETFRYVKVMTNPTIWYIRNYNHQAIGGQDRSVFGPAHITNIKINRAPDGHFQGFAKFPNIASSYDIEITFREAISHTRDTIGMVV